MKTLLKSILPTVFSICTLQGIAQQPDSIRLAVQYKMIHLIDTIQPSTPKSKEIQSYVLFIGHKISHFVTLDAIQLEARMKQFNASFPNNPPHYTWSRATENLGAPYQIIHYFNRNSLSNYTLLGGTCYEVEEPMPAINWTISSETKNILNYTCQKATTSFRGRNYEAWFCTDLPFSMGPWKLRGLPGLILEASDDKNEIVFTLEQISKTFIFNPYKSIDGRPPFKKVPDETKQTIQLIDADHKQQKINKTELDKTVALFRQDPVAFLKMLSGNQPIKGSLMGPGGSNENKSILFNNPIEKETTTKFK